MSKETVDFFVRSFGHPPSCLAKAPGRLEILGNHTDYNEGFVLSAAVGQATEFAIKAVPGRICRLISDIDNKFVEFNLDETENKSGERTWVNYIKGVICEIRKRGKKIGAFEAAVRSSVPLSAGMSSSAALEISAGFAFKETFEINLPLNDWARVGQGSENNYIGVKTGLLDQLSSIFGKKNSLILLDFRKVEVIKTAPVPEGYVFVVANTMIKHDLLTSDYNQRRESCERAVAGLKKKFHKIRTLRDVSMEMLEDGKSLVSHQDYMRALHIVGENRRVMMAVEALENRRIEELGKLLFESHQSSKANFENSCPELDYLVELAASIPGCVGARLSGGGFGGISIHLVKNAEAEKYCERLKTAYRMRTKKELETIICGIGDGASVEKIQ